MPKKEYIERKTVIEHLKEEGCDCELLPIIFNAPAADVSPIRHGHWLNFYGDFQTAECSECGGCYEVSDIDKSELTDGAAKMLFGAFADSYHYCPNCGAKMDMTGGEGE